MISVNYYFKIRVAYKYKIFASATSKTDTTEYEIVLNNIKNVSYSDIENEACNTAKQLCKEEYGNLPHYEYAGLAICEKKIIYIKK